jgi:hypothetical protein
MLKKHFLVALAYADTNQVQWAKSYNLHQSIVSNVLSGRAKSTPVLRLMEAFTAEQLPKLVKELTEAA